MKSTIKISGMTCNGCKSTVESKLGSLDGVYDVQVDLTKSEAIIYSKNPISFSLISDCLPSKYNVISNEHVQDNEIIKSSKIKQLKPLFIILGYILITSILLNFKDWNLTNAMLDFMGLFYIIFSFFKILDIKGFSTSFKMYDPLAKKITIYGYIYPFIEILLGVMFLTRIEVNIALLTTIVILGITCAGVTQTLLNKRSIN
jgi:copper chaperone CopZ